MPLQLQFLNAIATLHQGVNLCVNVTVDRFLPGMIVQYVGITANKPINQ